MEEKFNQKIKDCCDENVITKFPNIINSVDQIISYFRVNDPFTPHIKSNEQKGKGSGFIIDIENGLILTNAHVVQNSMYLYVSTEKSRQQDIELKVISLCIEKDVSLCQIINEQDRKEIQDGKSPEEINMKFIDSFKLKHLDKVFVIGYPLGLDNIKATGGTITGFYSNNDESSGNIFDNEDSPSYIETSAPVNPGNSGGSLINMNGEVIGIVSAGMRFAQNVNYAVGSRTILSIFSELSKSLSYKNKIIIPSKYSFKYNKTSEIQLKNLGEEKEGIYICKINPDSSFRDVLNEGDILCGISFNDNYKNIKCFNIKENDFCKKEDPKNKVSYQIKRNGFLVNQNYTNRKFVLKELFDSIPIGTEITFNIFRNNKFEDVKANFTNTNNKNSNKIKFILPEFEPYKFVITHGLCIGDLTSNHTALNSNLFKFVEEGENRYKNFLVINWVFPQTEASFLSIQGGSTIISKVNNVPVDKIENLEKILEQNKRKGSFRNYHF